MTCQRRVQHLVRKAEPGGSGGERYIDPRSVGLVARVQLSGVMQAQHDPVVLAAASLGDADALQEPRAARHRGARARQELTGKAWERLADAPGAWGTVRCDVAEQA